MKASTKNKWPTKRLEELAEFRNGVNYNKSSFGEGVKVVGVSDFQDYSKPRYAELEQINPEGIVTERNILRDCDIVFVRSNGNRELIGRSLFIEQPPEEITHSAFTIRLRFNSREVHPKFYAYCFRTRLIRQALTAQGGGTNINNLNQDILNALEVPLPPLPVQRRIAGILSAYDELMENSQRRIRILEAMARALYREWFVHFRFPGHERIRLVGGLPEGWTRKPLEEIAEFRLGKMLDQQKNRGDLLPYLANVNVRWGEFDLQELREMRFEQDELETYGLKFGDIVMCEGGEPGRCAIWKEQVPGMMIQKAIHRIRCRENMDHIYLYHSLRDQGESGHLAALFTGATIKHLPREKLARVTVVVPSAPLLKKFGDATISMEAQAETLQRQIQNLRRTRDLLLPRLLSGQVALNGKET